MSTSFETLHPRGNAGKFAAKSNKAPATPLIDGYQAYVTGYADEPIADRTALDEGPAESSMAIGQDQAGSVWSFAEEHRLEDGRYLSTIQYIYPAYAGEDQMNVVTETEQFTSTEPGAYAATAHLVREGSTWNRYDSAPIVCSVERATAMAKRAAADAHLHQSYFTANVPWTGEPLAATAVAFREASAQLNGN